MKTINLTLSWSETIVQNDGTLVMEIGGCTPGGVSTKVRVHMSPSTVGYIGEDLHKAIATQEATLADAKQRLKEG